MANLNLNQCVLCGHLTADPELKQTPNGVSVCRVTLAINRKYSKDGEQLTDFIACQAWRGTAEFVCKYFKKGQSLCLIGSIQTRNWTDQNGQKRWSADVVATEVYFVDKRSEGTEDRPSAGIQTAAYIPEAYTNPREDSQILSLDDELPF